MSFLDTTMFSVFEDSLYYLISILKSWLNYFSQYIQDFVMEKFFRFTVPKYCRAFHKFFQVIWKHAYCDKDKDKVLYCIWWRTSYYFKMITKLNYDHRFPIHLTVLTFILYFFLYPKFKQISCQSSDALAVKSGFFPL